MLAWPCPASGQCSLSCLPLKFYSYLFSLARGSLFCVRVRVWKPRGQQLESNHRSLWFLRRWCQSQEWEQRSLGLFAWGAGTWTDQGEWK